MEQGLLEFKINKMHRLADDSRVRAFVDISINDLLLIKGLKVVQGEKGLFVSMPQEQGKDKRWYDQVRCMNREIFGTITEKVLEAYHSTN